MPSSTKKGVVTVPLPAVRQLECLPDSSHSSISHSASRHSSSEKGAGSAPSSCGSAVPYTSAGPGVSRRTSVVSTAEMASRWRRRRSP